MTYLFTNKQIVMAMLFAGHDVIDALLLIDMNP